MTTDRFLHDDVVRRLARARSAIHDAPGAPLTVPDLAREACLSERHFARAFAQLYGETPGRYLTRVRLARARDLLARGVSVTEACFAVGFESVGSFSARFTRDVKMSPREFQRSVRAVGSVPVRLGALYVPLCFFSFYAPLVVAE